MLPTRSSSLISSSERPAPLGGLDYGEEAQYRRVLRRWPPTRAGSGRSSMSPREASKNPQSQCPSRSATASSTVCRRFESSRGHQSRGRGISAPRPATRASQRLQAAEDALPAHARKPPVNALALSPRLRLWRQLAQLRGVAAPKHDRVGLERCASAARLPRSTSFAPALVAAFQASRARRRSPRRCAFLNGRWPISMGSTMPVAIRAVPSPVPRPRNSIVPPS